MGTRQSFKERNKRAAELATTPMFSEALDSSMVPDHVLRAALGGKWRADRSDLSTPSLAAQRERAKNRLPEQRVLSLAEVSALTFELIPGVEISVVDYDGALRVDSEGLRNILDFSLVQAGYPNINTNTVEMRAVWRGIRETHQRMHNGEGKSQEVVHDRKVFFPFGQAKKMFAEFMSHSEVRDLLLQRYPQTENRAHNDVTTIAEGLISSISRRINDLTRLSKKPDLR